MFFNHSFHLNCYVYIDDSGVSCTVCVQTTSVNSDNEISVPDYSFPLCITHMANIKYHATTGIMKQRNVSFNDSLNTFNYGYIKSDIIMVKDIFKVRERKLTAAI